MLYIAANERKLIIIIIIILIIISTGATTHCGFVFYSRLAGL